MKKILKITIILLLMFTFQMYINHCYAMEIINDVNHYRPIQNQANEEEVMNITGSIVTAIRVVGIIISVIALMCIGIRMMVASTQEKSILKESLPGYILGAIMVMAITILPSIIYQLVQNI